MSWQIFYIFMGFVNDFGELFTINHFLKNVPVIIEELNWMKIFFSLDDQIYPLVEINFQLLWEKYVHGNAVIEIGQTSRICTDNFCNSRTPGIENNIISISIDSNGGKNANTHTHSTA